ncbi:phosphotransferase family protein [Gordonia zhaorongruii]|uniref:phosphotransferase family protein n=1 Tax=Gordonia zhaorongruii TaxID=2597659 RepID=UPI00104900F6|nr:phosphotransferase family protein [Gordonia zhaorongruii]
MLPRSRHLTNAQCDDVADWLAPRLPGTGGLAIEPLEQSAGNSHQIFSVRRGSRRWVMRVAPSGTTAGGHGGFDLVHEWHVLQSIAGSDIPHAAAAAVSDESAPVANAILVIEFVDGHVLHGPLPADHDNPRDAHRIADSVADVLARLTRFDWRATKLAPSGDESTYLPRQFTKGRRMIEEARTRDTVVIDRLFDTLEQHMPRESRLALIHGDYSTMNIMVGRDADPRVTAVLDWETATIGDALIDIGYLTARWVRPDENPILAGFTVGGPDPKHHEALPDRRYLADRFAQASGLSLAELPFYQGFAMARLVAALEPRVARARARGDEQSAEAFAAMVDSCAEHGLRLMGES